MSILKILQFGFLSNSGAAMSGPIIWVHSNVRQDAPHADVNCSNHNPIMVGHLSRSVLNIRNIVGFALSMLLSSQENLCLSHKDSLEVH